MSYFLLKDKYIYIANYRSPAIVDSFLFSYYAPCFIQGN